MAVEAIVGPVTLSRLDPKQQRLISAVRFWALAGRMRWCAVRSVTERLGSPRATAHFRLILEEIGTAWPDPFYVSPPCAPSLSYDEATAADMLRLAGAGDRRGFDLLLCDLLPADIRERLFLSFAVFDGVLDG